MEQWGAPSPQGSWFALRGQARNDAGWGSTTRSLKGQKESKHYVKPNCPSKESPHLPPSLEYLLIDRTNPRSKSPGLVLPRQPFASWTIKVIDSGDVTSSECPEVQRQPTQTPESLLQCLCPMCSSSPGPVDGPHSPEKSRHVGEDCVPKVPKIDPESEGSRN